MPGPGLLLFSRKTRLPQLYTSCPGETHKTTPRLHCPSFCFCLIEPHRTPHSSHLGPHRRLVTRSALSKAHHRELGSKLKNYVPTLLPSTCTFLSPHKWPYTFLQVPSVCLSQYGLSHAMTKESNTSWIHLPPPTALPVL